MTTRSALLRRPSPAATTAFLLGCMAAAVPVEGAAQGHAFAQEEASGEGPGVTEGVDFRVYDRAGTPSSLAAIVAAMSGAEVLLVGEEHDDLPGHAVEVLLLEAAIERYGPAGARTRPVVLSLEMFERDVQYVVDEYLADQISEAHFLRSARPWDDYERRYRSMLEAAKHAGVPVVAANAPRRYVNMVSRAGPESLASLSALARSYLPPLPYPGPSERYRAEWDALMAEAMADAAFATPSSPDSAPVGRTGQAQDPDASPDSGAGVEPGVEHPQAAAGEATAAEHSPGAGAIYAQALWDAAMGHAVAGALMERLGALVIHVAGSFHVARGTGIPERIDDYRPGTRITTVVMTKADAIDVWSDDEHADLADFVVLTLKPVEATPSARSPSR